MVFCVQFYFLFKTPATTQIYTYCHTLSLHDALPIFGLRHADQLCDVPHRHGLIAALREQAGGCVEQLGSHIGHQKSSLVERPLSALVSDSPMAVQRACAEAIRTGDSANACASSCPAAPADTDARWMHDGAELDRKSTRLNSSH